MSDKHEELDVRLPDGTLRVLRWGTGGQAVLAVHGITASAMSWQAVARELPANWSLYAVDLRGRGHSAGLPGPYGFGRHVADLAAAATDLGLDHPVLAGHSLGAFAALLAATQHADLFGGLLLVDGGLPLPALPADADPDAILDATLGPALARLRQTYPTIAAYFDFWRAHPALKDAWNSDIEDYLRYDLTGPEGALRSRVVEAAARTDGRELLTGTEGFAAALGALPGPVTLLTAPAGLFGVPPGLQPDELVAAWQPQAPLLLVEEVPGCNHYTLVLDPAHAATVAAHITRASFA